MELILDIRRKHRRDFIFYDDDVADCYSKYLSNVLRGFINQHHMTIVLDNTGDAFQTYLNRFEDVDHAVVHADGNDFITKHGWTHSILLNPFNGPITKYGINSGIKLFDNNKSTICLSCSLLPHNCHPDWLLRYDCTTLDSPVLDGGKLKKIHGDREIARSQDLNDLFFPHGSIQVFDNSLVALDSTRVLYFPVTVTDDSPFFYRLPIFSLDADVGYRSV